MAAAHILVLLVLTGCGDTVINVRNAAPVVSITYPLDDAEFHEGEIVPLRGSVTDPDKGDTVTATWYSGETVLCAEAAPDVDGNTFCDVSLTEEQQEITLDGRDQSGASESDQITLKIFPNQVPTASISSPLSEGEWYSDEPIPFEGVVADQEDAASDLVIVWESSLEGVLDLETTPDGEGRISDVGYLGAGQHELYLKVTDSEGAQGSDLMVLTVHPPNLAPTCQITGPADGSLSAPGEPVLFEGLVGDADSSPEALEATWASDQDGELGESSPDRSGYINFTTGDLSLATHVITLTVVDEQGDLCTDSILYSVGAPPEAVVDSPIDGSIYDEGEAIPFVVHVSDADQSPSQITVTVDSDRDGPIYASNPDDTGILAFSLDDLSIGSHVLTFVATDPDELYAQVEVGMTVNGLPSAPIVVISPNPARTADDLQVLFTTPSSDPDGAIVSYSYAWYQDGNLRSQYGTDLVPASATTKGEEWRVVVTPLDGISSGPSAEDSVTIANTVPTAPGVSMDPLDPIEGVDDLICQIDRASSDADGDSVHYTLAWTMDGSPISTTGTTWRTGDTVAASGTVAEEEWSCTVTPNDGTSNGSAATATVFILGVPISYGHTQFPCSASIVRQNDTLDVYGWVYQPGCTDSNGRGACITAEAGLGDDGTDPATDPSWTWVSASYWADQPAYGNPSLDPAPYNNDEYKGVIQSPVSIGSYDYAFRFSTDSGLSWTYADLGLDCGGDGTLTGYSTSTTGDLTVVP